MAPRGNTEAMMVVLVNGLLRLDICVGKFAACVQIMIIYGDFSCVSNPHSSLAFSPHKCLFTCI